MPEYKFVAMYGNGGEQAALNKSVRSHAIRAGLKKRTSSSRVKTGAATVSGTTDPQRGFLGLAGRNQNYLRTHMNKSVCPGSVDPFSSLPISTNLQVDFLIKYCRFCLARQATPSIITKSADWMKVRLRYDSYSAGIDRSKSWFPYALQSAPMMHSTLAMTAVLWRAEFPGLQRSVLVEGMRQKGEAIREIQAQLVKVSSVNTLTNMNFLLSTMSTLAITAVCDGDFGAAETHFQGVHAFVSSCGGRSSFDGEFVLSKSVDLADIQVATALGRLPSFPSSRAGEAHLPESITATCNSQLFHPSLVDSGCCGYAEIFIHTRQLLLACQSSAVSPESLRIHFNVIDGEILQYLYQDHAESCDTKGLSRALVQAAHIFIYVIMRRVPPSSPLVGQMCKRLRHTVEPTPKDGENWAENKEALSWIAFVGLLGIGEKVELCLEKQFFLNLFRSSTQGCSDDFSQEASVMRKTLSSFLWDEAYCQPLLEDLQNCQES